MRASGPRLRRLAALTGLPARPFFAAKEIDGKMRLTPRDDAQHRRLDQKTSSRSP